MSQKEQKLWASIPDSNLSINLVYFILKKETQII